MSSQMAVESLYATGKWFLDQGQTHKAVDIFRVLVLVAASDERGWLGIGASHDALGEATVAVELYTLGAAATKSIRCQLAKARLLRKLSRDDEASAALDAAESMLDDDDDDDDLRHLVECERRAS